MANVTIRELVDFLNNWAPFAYQEPYDNSGLITGDPRQTVTGVLVSLDCTEAVVEEAVRKGCNVVVAHHPILFRPLKSLTGKNYVERTLISAIRQQVSIVAVHTNLDNIHTGVNRRIADRLGLTNVSVLSPARGHLAKLVTFVPESHQADVRDSLSKAGAGKIGTYDACSFSVEGTGRFRPGEGAQPWIGSKGKLEETPEIRLEVIFPKHLEPKIIQALDSSHPYEEPAYFITLLNNEHPEVGAGMVGDLPDTVPMLDFLRSLKDRMSTPAIRHSHITTPEVRRVAVCGGAGSFLVEAAVRSGAQVFVSSDFKYHEFFDADGRIVIADIGHYESEQFTKELIREVLVEKFTTFASLFSETATNPISYL